LNKANYIDCNFGTIYLSVAFCTVLTAEITTKRVDFYTLTRRVKKYTRFAGKYVTGRKKHFRLYIFLIRITSRVDLAMSVRIKAEISETTKAGKLGLACRFWSFLRGAGLF